MKMNLAIVAGDVPEGCIWVDRGFAELFSETNEVALSDETATQNRELRIGDTLSDGRQQWHVSKIDDFASPLIARQSTTAKIERIECVLDVVEARSIGPYSLVTQHPQAESGASGGQMVSRSTIETMLRLGWNWTAWEMLTIKSDAVVGRQQTFESAVLGTGSIPGCMDALDVAPETVHVFCCHLLAMGLRFAAKDETASLRLVSNDKIRDLSHGEIKIPETIHHQTLEPALGGLFCTKIFGPERDFECQCGRYNGRKFAGIVCEKCLVEVIESTSRRRRFGHVSLPVSIPHPLFLDVISTLLEYDIYAAIVDEGKESPHDHTAQAVLGLNLMSLAEGGDERADVARNLIAQGISPGDLLLCVVPVLPPTLRPIVRLPSGEFVTSDHNDLYRRVINRSNRLKKLKELDAPEVILNDEYCQLFQAVDGLFGTGTTVVDFNGRQLVPLWNSVQTNLRRLEEKSVDYSGRTTLVCGDENKIPMSMALELFVPWIYQVLRRDGHASTSREADQLIAKKDVSVVAALNEIVPKRPIIVIGLKGVVAANFTCWDEYALALEPNLATQVGSGHVSIHVPISVQANIEVLTRQDCVVNTKNELDAFFESSPAGLVPLLWRGEVPLPMPFRLAWGERPLPNSTTA